MALARALMWTESSGICCGLGLDGLEPAWVDDGE